MAGAAAGVGSASSIDQTYATAVARARRRLPMCSKTAHYGTLAASAQWNPLSLAGIFLELLHKVIEQTQRRVLSGEAVAAQEKICSVFEEHTDILKKSPRETVFGHKVFLSTGPSSLILDCVVERGNPADSNYVQPFLERHRELYGQVPRQSAWDGGFASAANLSWAKEQGVEDVAFAKKCGLTVESMVRSSWVYLNSNASAPGSRGALGPSSTGSGLDRCTWKGWPHFQSYVHASVLTYNLVVLARPGSPWGLTRLPLRLRTQGEVCAPAKFFRASGLLDSRWPRSRSSGSAAVSSLLSNYDSTDYNSENPAFRTGTS